MHGWMPLLLLLLVLLVVVPSVSLASSSAQGNAGEAGQGGDEGGWNWQAGRQAGPGNFWRWETLGEAYK